MIIYYYFNQASFKNILVLCWKWKPMTLKGFYDNAALIVLFVIRKMTKMLNVEFII